MDHQFLLGKILSHLFKFNLQDFLMYFEVYVHVIQDKLFIYHIDNDDN